ncbi:MAG TPA: Twin-arginine translocation pathway signal sequence domain-containing protein, partial [Casimicrobiaceae bacterium]
MTIDHSRRRFLRSGVALPIAGSLSVAHFGTATAAFAAAPANDPYRRLLVLVELKGGNDGLNTVVPYADPAYYALRPKLAIAPDHVVQLSERVGLHPALKPLATFWRARELAVLQGVGYPAPNLSHFRSIEIWDTASSSDAYLQDGWLTRTFARSPV